MNDNPFAAPATRSSRGPQALDISAAFSQGTQAFGRLWMPWSLGTLLSSLALGLSLVLCLVPALVVGPAIVAGMYLFALRAVDDPERPPELGVMFSGFEDIGRHVPPMLVLGLVFIVVQIPVQVVSFAAGYVSPQDLASQLLTSGVTTLLGMVYNAIVWTRFSLSVPLVVDRQIGALDALSTSWEATAGSWLQLALLNLVAGVLTVLGVIGCYVGLFVTAGWASAIQIAAYRQLVPKE
ncbi:MAG TPA: hypothetical protein PKA64_09020 [Myxococcota bacterium]|nr:hypothetical protein [Myxococcota bacterium]